MPSRRRPAERRRRRLRLILLPAAFVLVALAVLAVLALPFRHAPGEAEAARTDLRTAKQALQAGDFEQARTAVDSARGHVDEVQDSVQGVGGDVWSWMPFVGGSVRDVRRLGNALDELTAVAQTGVEIWPAMTGDKATLFDNGSVDLDTLERLTDTVRDASSRLESAQAELAEVADERLVTGTRLADARDEALSQVEPVVDGAQAAEPLLDALPGMLGRGSERKYIVALLNPSEMLYSGGTPQSFTTLAYDKGQLTVSETIDLFKAPWIVERRYWKKVKGNPFHRGQLRLATSTMTPDWSIAGHELANAWRSIRSRPMAGVIAIDVVALADLVALTGPVELPGLGTLTSDNLVKTLVGSYDRYPDNAARHAVNRKLGDLFATRLLTGDPLETGKALAEAARERHFAVFFRNDDEQAAFDELGVTGRLAEPDRDYLGVFTQTRVGVKSDYWQRREVRSDVTVNEDGSAEVRLRVRIHNDSPPYLGPEPDPRTGYTTRWNNLSVLTMLPPNAQITRGTVDGTPFDIQMGTYYGLRYQRHAIEFAPQAAHVLEIEYDVPAVAQVDADGSLSYRLDVDPQGMINPQATTVRVTFPQGFAVGDLPDGWSAGSGGRTATFRTPGLEASQSFELAAHP